MLVDAAGGDGLSIHFHGQDGIRMDDALQFEQRVLGEDKVAENLHAARGGTRTSTDEHQQEEDNPKEDRPSHIVADEKTRSGEGRDDAEKRLAERSAKALVAAKEKHQYS